jgi:hypothetical protein
VSNHFNTPNTFDRLATKKDRAAAGAAFATMVRWCKSHRAEHTDDCGEVDFTSLAIACAEAHGCDDPGENHPAWDAATAACE